MNTLEKKTGFRLDKTAVDRLTQALENYHKLPPGGAIGTKQVGMRNGEEENLKAELFKCANDLIAMAKTLKF
jgi:hypothetical protein